MKSNPKLILAVGMIALAPWLISATDTRGISENSTVVSIVGKGYGDRLPPILTIRTGVETFNTDASRAMSENSRVIERLRAELRRSGISSEDVRSSNLQLSPGKKYVRGGDDIEGFNVNHSLTIVFRDVNKSGAVVDALVDAGAKSVSGPDFSHEVEGSVDQKTRLAAIRDANQQAHFYAKALGLRVKRVVTIRDGGSYASTSPALRTMNVEGPGTSIAVGRDVVRASVIADYELVR
jgi:uncharacterized protein YggE